MILKGLGFVKSMLTMNLICVWTRYYKIFGNPSSIVTLLANPLINPSNTRPSTCATDAQCKLAQFLCCKQKLHILHTYVYVQGLCDLYLFPHKLKLHIHAQLIQMGLNFSDLRGTVFFLILNLTPYIGGQSGVASLF